MIGRSIAEVAYAVYLASLCVLFAIAVTCWLVGRWMDGARRRLGAGRFRFRKRPMIVDAFRLGIDPWPDWAWARVGTNEIIIHGERGHLERAFVRKLQGRAEADRGDYICRQFVDGVEDVWPCNRAVFERTYEAIKA